MDSNDHPEIIDGSYDEGLPTDMVNLPADQVIEMMRTSLNALASVALPDEFDKPFSEAHCIMWNLMTESIMTGYHDVALFEKFALGLPRGHAKTTMLKLLCLFAVLFSNRRFILVLCSTFGKAASFLDDVTLLLDSPNIVTLFGRWDIDAEKDNDKLKKFRFKGRLVILKPQGVGGSIRGTSEAFQRPDIIICDDIQEKEDAENPVQAEKLLNWFLATLVKARNLRVCTMIYLGNMYKDLELGQRGSGIYCCLLRNLKANPEWTSMIVGAILADGTALWEAVVSKESLLADLRQDTAMGRSDIFFAESMNDPTVTVTKFYDPGKVPELPYNQFDVVIGKFIIIDPSLGNKKSDEQAVGLFYVYDEKGPVFQELRIIQKSSPELVQEIIMWCLTEKVPLVCAEAVAYQGTLLQWFVFWCNTLQIKGIEFAPVTPRGLSKVSRILTYLKSLMSGHSMMSPAVKPFVDNQAAFYKPTAANNIDDTLDVGAYGEQAFLEYSSLYILPLEAQYKDVSNSKDDDKYPQLLAHVKLPSY